MRQSLFYLSVRLNHKKGGKKNERCTHASQLAKHEIRCCAALASTTLRLLYRWPHRNVRCWWTRTSFFFLLLSISSFLSFSSLFSPLCLIKSFNAVCVVGYLPCFSRARADTYLERWATHFAFLLFSSLSILSKNSSVFHFFFLIFHF